MKIHRFRPFLLALFLILSLAAGCTRPAAPQAPGLSSEAESAPDLLSGSPDEDGSKTPETAKAVQARFDEFTDRIFCDLLKDDPLSLHFILQNPEAFGIETQAIAFPEISAEALEENAREDEALQAELDTFDPALLTSDQLFTWKLLQDALETEALARGMELYYQPLSPLIGEQAQLPTLLAEYAFYGRDDIEDYLTLLSCIDGYYEQLAEYERERAAAGLTLSDAAIDRILQSCRDYLIRPENSFLVETFAERLEDVEGLTEEEKEEYKERHLTILKEHFIPAYTNLSAALEELKGSGQADGGLCTYERGKEYYAYLVASLTGTDSSVPQLRQRIEKQIGADMGQIGLLLQENPRLSLSMSASSIELTDPEEILLHLQKEIEHDFPPLSDTSFEIKYVPKALESSLSPAFFLVPPLDYEGPGVIYINGDSGQEANLYTMLAHEGYPGHLYQSVYFNRKNSCPLHRLLTCGGYNEGWGLYCELYSYSFDNGLEDDMKRLMACSESSTYGLYALMDIRVNYDGWDEAKLSGFLDTFYGITDPEVVREIFLSLTDNPGNYLKYYTGYLEILTMRTAAEEALGERFDIKRFHQFILDMEGAPFRVIKPYFQTWLLTY